MKHEQHTPIEKVWWWVVTIYYYFRRPCTYRARMAARQDCIDSCKL